jgi:hypothetical protein
MALAPERDAESSYGLLRVYSYYRATLSLLLILMYFLLRRSESAPVLQHELYLYTAIPYAVLAIGQLVFVLLRPVSPRPRHIFAMLLVDIVCQMLITHASGGASPSGSRGTTSGATSGRSRRSTDARRSRSAANKSSPNC